MEAELRGLDTTIGRLVEATAAGSPYAQQVLPQMYARRDALLMQLEQLREEIETKYGRGTMPLQPVPAHTPTRLPAAAARQVLPFGAWLQTKIPPAMRDRVAKDFAVDRDETEYVAPDKTRWVKRGQSLERMQ